MAEINHKIMPIFKINNSKLEPISEKKIDLEHNIQKLTEQNLETIFGLKFISGSLNQEFSIKAQEQDFYIDTLAFDEEQKSFTIIEYKKDKSFSVIDQGFAYLSAMLNHKADFVLELNERLHKNFTKKDIDWEQSRIIFISWEFTNYQKNAINFKDLPIFLYEVKFYNNNIIDYNPIKPFRTSESIEKFTKDKTIQKVAKEVKVYTLEDHLKKASQETAELFNELYKKIHDLDSRITEKPVTWYIGFKVRYHNFCLLVVFKDKIGIYVRASKISDDKKLFKKIPSKWGWGKTPLWRTDIKNQDEISYVISVIKQGYEDAPDK